MQYFLRLELSNDALALSAANESLTGDALVSFLGKKPEQALAISLEEFDLAVDPSDFDSPVQDGEIAATFQFTPVEAINEVALLNAIGGSGNDNFGAKFVGVSFDTPTPSSFFQASGGFTAINTITTKYTQSGQSVEVSGQIVNFEENGLQVLAPLRSNENQAAEAVAFAPGSDLELVQPANIAQTGVAIDTPALTAAPTEELVFFMRLAGGFANTVWTQIINFEFSVDAGGLLGSSPVTELTVERLSDDASLGFDYLLGSGADAGRVEIVSLVRGASGEFEQLAAYQFANSQTASSSFADAGQGLINSISRDQQTEASVGPDGRTGVKESISFNVNFVKILGDSLVRNVDGSRVEGVEFQTNDTLPLGDVKFDLDDVDLQTGALMVDGEAPAAFDFTEVRMFLFGEAASDAADQNPSLELSFYEFSPDGKAVSFGIKDFENVGSAGLNALQLENGFTIKVLGLKAGEENFEVVETLEVGSADFIEGGVSIGYAADGRTLEAQVQVAPVSDIAKTVFFAGSLDSETLTFSEGEGWGRSNAVLGSGGVRPTVTSFAEDQSLFIRLLDANGDALTPFFEPVEFGVNFAAFGGLGPSKELTLDRFGSDLSELFFSLAATGESFTIEAELFGAPRESISINQGAELIVAQSEPPAGLARFIFTDVKVQATELSATIDQGEQGQDLLTLSFGAATFQQLDFNSDGPSQSVNVFTYDNPTDGFVRAAEQPDDLTFFAEIDQNGELVEKPGNPTAPLFETIDGLHVFLTIGDDDDTRFANDDLLVNAGFDNFSGSFSVDSFDLNVANGGPGAPFFDALRVTVADDDNFAILDRLAANGRGVDAVQINLSAVDRDGAVVFQVEAPDFTILERTFQSPTDQEFSFQFLNTVEYSVRRSTDGTANNARLVTTTVNLNTGEVTRGGDIEGEAFSDAFQVIYGDGGGTSDDFRFGLKLVDAPGADTSDEFLRIEDFEIDREAKEITFTRSPDSSSLLFSFLANRDEGLDPAIGQGGLLEIEVYSEDTKLQAHSAYLFQNLTWIDQSLDLTGRETVRVSYKDFASTVILPGVSTPERTFEENRTFDTTTPVLGDVSLFVGRDVSLMNFDAFVNPITVQSGGAGARAAGVNQPNGFEAPAFATLLDSPPVSLAIEAEANEFLSLAAAIEASAPGSTLVITAQPSDLDPAPLEVDNLTFDIAAGVFIDLFGNDDVATATLLGEGGARLVFDGAADQVVDASLLSGGIDFNGGGGNDVLAAGNGNDTITDGVVGDGQGADTLDGGQGDDLFIVPFANGDNYIGGEGDDTLDVSLDTASYIVALGGTFNQFGADFSGFENFIGTPDNDTVADVLGQNNLIEGRGGADTIDGAGGDDTLDGGDGTDSVLGGAGDDIIRDLDGDADLLFGGADNDTIVSSFLQVGDTLDGGDGVDLLSLGQLTSALSGPNAIDLSLPQLDLFGAVLTGFEDVTGTSFGDQITGNDVNNILRGGGGADTLDGGLGNDQLFGGGGADVLTDNDTQFADSLFGGAGNDTITPVFALDGEVFDGGDDIDLLDLSLDTGNFNILIDETTRGFSQFGAEFSGFEQFLLTQQDDIFTGGGGEETVAGGGGADFLSGGGGNDEILGSLADGDTLRGDAGVDTLILPDIGVTLDLSVEDTIGGAVVSGFENLSTGDGDDSITGTDGANLLILGLGADSVQAGAGDDTVELIAEGGGDADVIDLGANDDVFRPGEVGFSSNVTGGIGFDTIDLTNVAGTAAGTELSLFNFATSFESVLTGDNELIVFGNNAANLLAGGAGQQQFLGFDGDDTLVGGDGDLLIGDGDDDLILLTEIPVSGVFIGGDGDDTLSFEQANGALFGDEFLTGEFFLADFETVRGSGGGDRFATSDFGGSQLIDGLGGVDVLTVDTNDGSADGGEGEDRLIAQSGRSGVVLTGGDNADTFVLAAGGGSVLITDFNADESDTLDLSAIPAILLIEALARTAPTASELILADGSTLIFDGVQIGDIQDQLVGDADPTGIVLGGVNGEFIPASDNSVFALGGDDTLGSGGFSTLAGGEGADTYDLRGGGFSTIIDQGGDGVIIAPDGVTLDNLTLFAQGFDLFLGDGETVFAQIRNVFNKLGGPDKTIDLFGEIRFANGDVFDLFNNAPAITQDFIATTESGLASINLLANDFDLDNAVPGLEPQMLEVVSVNDVDLSLPGQVLTLASGATVQVSFNGGFLYDPNGAFDTLGEGETAFEVISYTISDGIATSNAETVVVTITGENEAPVADNDAASVAAGQSVAGDLLTNDADPNGDALTVTRINGAALGPSGSTVTLASGAELTVGADGAFNFDTGAAFIGLVDGETATETFTYRAEDPFGGTDTATAAITINGVNDAPTITSGAAFSAAENQAAVGTVAASDPESGVTFSLTGGADAPLFSINAATGAFSFRTAPDFEAPGDAGDDNVHNLQITAADTEGLTTTQSVTVTVTDVNEAPAITSGAAFTAAENQTSVGTVAASDPESGVTFSLTGGADAALFAINATTGALSFRTAPDFEAPGDAGGDNVHDILVTVTDSGGLTAVQSITVTVTDVNEAPVAAASSTTGDEDTVISGALLASDVDGDALSFSVVDGPSNGSVTLGANGSFQFTPAADFSGTDNFTFRASDGDLSDTATATITVNPVDEPVDPPNPTDPPGPVDPPAPAGPTNGDDTLLGTALHATITALSCTDNVSGLAGDDLLLGGGGDDSIKGAAGDDRLRGNRGEDTLKGGGGDDNIKGNGGADVLRGNGGDDVIRAGGGDDNVKGGGGADLILGGGGADRLNGGGGADTLKGNGGDDTLKGNGGADVFQFRTSDRNDTIADFRQGQDRIEIQNGARSFNALTIEQDGRDVLISFGVAGQVRVITDNAAAFDESDFIF